MYYLFEESILLEEEKNYISKLENTLYYDGERIIDANGNTPDLNKREVKVFVTAPILNKVIKQLELEGAILENRLKNIKDIKAWYGYHEVKRKLLPLEGIDFNDKEILEYIKKTFDKRIFFKTEEKDYSGIIELDDLLDENSDIRKTINEYKDKNYIISEIMHLDEDEYGTKEYRVFVRDYDILNISRFLDTTYHKIPEEVVEYARDVVDDIDPSFAHSYVFDICSHDGGILEVTEFNPMESSGRYLYNSAYTKSNDLTHEDIENIPEEHKIRTVLYVVFEKSTPSLKDLSVGEFAQSYYNRKYNKNTKEKSLKLTHE